MPAEFCINRKPSKNYKVSKQENGSRGDFTIKTQIERKDLTLISLMANPNTHHYRKEKKAWVDLKVS